MPASTTAISIANTSRNFEGDEATDAAADRGERKREKATPKTLSSAGTFILLNGIRCIIKFVINGGDNKTLAWICAAAAVGIGHSIIR
jgi:hypothetical protein